MGELLLANLACQGLPWESLEVVITVDAGIGGAVNEFELMLTHFIDDRTIISWLLSGGAVVVVIVNVVETWAVRVAHVAQVHTGCVETFVHIETARRAVIEAVC